MKSAKICAICGLFLILMVGSSVTLAEPEPSPSKKYGVPRDMTALQFDAAGAAEQAMKKEFDPKNRIIFSPPAELKFFQRSVESKFHYLGLDRSVGRGQAIRAYAVESGGPSQDLRGRDFGASEDAGNRHSLTPIRD